MTKLIQFTNANDVKNSLLKNRCSTHNPHLLPHRRLRIAASRSPNFWTVAAPMGHPVTSRRVATWPLAASFVGQLDTIGLFVRDDLSSAVAYSSPNKHRGVWSIPSPGLDVTYCSADDCPYTDSTKANPSHSTRTSTLLRCARVV